MNSPKIIITTFLCAFVWVFSSGATTANLMADKMSVQDGQTAPGGNKITAAEEDTRPTGEETTGPLPEETRTGEFTAYNPSRAQTDSTPLQMASGRLVYEGAMACPEWYEFGTLIEVEDMGVFVCEDRMAKRYRSREYFDIMMFDRSNALRFGRQTLSYRVL